MSFLQRRVERGRAQHLGEGVLDPFERSKHLALCVAGDVALYVGDHAPLMHAPLEPGARFGARIARRHGVLPKAFQPAQALAQLVHLVMHIIDRHQLGGGPAGTVTDHHHGLAAGAHGVNQLVELLLGLLQVKGGHGGLLKLAH
ncbi:hypothetical protein [Cupriavidus basilensis]